MSSVPGLARAVVPAAALVLVVLLACGRAEEPAPGPAEAPGAAEAPDVHPVLAAHSEEFVRRVYEVAPGVHQAVGFGLANSILVEGEGCAFVVDAMASVEAAREVRDAFREITDAPIAALVYTHNHADHVLGGRGLVPDGDVPVYAHESTRSYIERVVSKLRPVVSRRADRMFGTHLPEEGPDRRVNDGIGPFLEAAHGGGTPGLLMPTHTFGERLEVDICGVRVHLEHAPGETPDQLFVWLPERRVLMPGDNVYKAFPNLYTIRGTLYRDPMAWVHSLDRMRALRPAHLAPSHTRPVSGEAEIQEILAAYRDAIQYVHDQTVRGINRGLTPDELVEEVRLPPHLARHPWLQELYGTVEWSVRSVFAGNLGWFDGDTATLEPPPPGERARGYVRLAGGRDAMLEAVREAQAEGRFDWAAELAGHLVRSDPDDAEARRAKAAALRALGRRSVSPNGRNYYLTQALELEGEVRVEVPEPGEEVMGLLAQIPIGNFLASMPVNLDPAKSLEVDAVMGFHFPDVGEDWTLHVRHGVAELRRGFPLAPDHAITADSDAWKAVVAGIRGLPGAVASGDVRVEGGVTAIPGVLGFLAMFR
jgi:alkyl sulfatase BDS1-like metallo-beta-lactamase superfamily hydrolase